MRKTRPEQNTLRMRKGFCFLPKTIRGETRWLEKATWEERATYWVHAISEQDAGWSWVPIRWID